MKNLLLIVSFIFIFSCNKLHTKSSDSAAIDSLRKEIKEMKEKYKPGLGEIMSGVQMHHSKLWFAGINANWKLAEYETSELKERLVQAMEIATERSEVKNIPIMFSPIDSIFGTIKNQNIQQFKTQFISITNACNTCHSLSKFEFNKVIVPFSMPVFNQEFKLH